MFHAKRYAPYAQALFPYYQELARILFSSFRFPISRVIDVGCGTGHFTIAIRQNCSATTVIGVDNNPSMLGYAERWSDPPNITFIRQEGLSCLKSLNICEHDIILFKGS